MPRAEFLAYPEGVCSQHKHHCSRWRALRLCPEGGPQRNKRVKGQLQQAARQAVAAWGSAQGAPRKFGCCRRRCSRFQTPRGEDVMTEDRHRVCSLSSGSPSRPQGDRGRQTLRGECARTGGWTGAKREVSHTAHGQQSWLATAPPHFPSSLHPGLSPRPLPCPGPPPAGKC